MVKLYMYMDGLLTYKQMEKNEFTKELDTPNYTFNLQFKWEEGVMCLFLHLSVKNWSKSVLKDLKADLDDILKLAASYDIESVSFVVPKQIGTKFHKMVKPLSYEIYEQGYIIGGWYTEI